MSTQPRRRALVSAAKQTDRISDLAIVASVLRSAFGVAAARTGTSQ